MNASPRTKETPAPEATTRTHFGFREVDASDKARLVGEVFDKVAARYDLMNDMMSGGLHRVWKDAMIAWLNPPRSPAGAPWRVVDVAGGTGDIAFRIADKAPRADIDVIDINPEMLGVGARRWQDRGGGERVRFTAGDAMALPLPDASRDAYTIAFGIRNVTDVNKALAEAYRVLRPGGRFLCLEFSAVDVPGLDRIYDLYSFNVIPAMGRMVIGDAEPYQYLVESIRRFPDQETFAGMIARAGFARAQFRNLSGGIAALHSGWKI
ncbi:MAG: bifunctional demethylmenaquinone methyltransferase/2-methoxy-6-polyprenyl-1,4-benzoquinol methylase UbiE [Rhodobiaceae bacterium]|nr:bifunctional demethylmenaquinone methyltransferase/2-methoxy-6-polyprenyl-1,4-benzoquinol methylase UbiE [Rhodobiaceae bacterium]MCC0042470.1 bifunctional demethylmenaquinone methyltransferase/2-methoxy-6-polyprenyl-1,4-benzoquinol methylase UbiE [Rhodobiaceae bacterium]